MSPNETTYTASKCASCDAGVPMIGGTHSAGFASEPCRNYWPSCRECGILMSEDRGLCYCCNRAAQGDAP